MNYYFENGVDELYTHNLAGQRPYAPLCRKARFCGV